MTSGIFYRATGSLRYVIAKKNGADFNLRRLFRSSWTPGSYFFDFLPPDVGTVAIVCRMRPAIL